MDAWKTTMEDNKNTDGWNINIYSPGNFIAREIKFEGPVSIGGQTDSDVRGGVRTPVPGLHPGE